MYKLFEYDGAVVRARNDGREAARRLGASKAGCTLVATVVSELARNLVRHGGGGELRISLVDNAVVIDTFDGGPGIRDVTSALIAGYSTNGGAGQGLSGIARVAQHLTIENVGPSGLWVRVVLGGPKLGLPVDVPAWAACRRSEASRSAAS